MRNVCCSVLSGADSLDVTGDKIDSNQLVSASFHAYFGDVNAAGTFKIQASNDPCPAGNLPATFTPTHWVDIPNMTAAVTTGAAKLITIPQMAYRWVRAVWLNTGTGAATITTVADVAGSLNSKYFLYSSQTTNYYVWMNINSAGVDPMVAGRTGVEVAAATGVTAANLATAIASAMDALATVVSTSLSNVVTATNSAAGPFIAASAGNSGFTVTPTAGGTTTVNVNMDALGV